jgi:hypothetical protein
MARWQRCAGHLVALLAPLVFAAATPASAQQPAAVVTGRITDALAAISLSGVTVSVDGTRLSTTTDTAGRYRLAGVPAGPQVIVAERIGYAPLRSPIVVPAEGSVTLDLALAKNALQLPGLIVTADATSRVRGELGTASVIGQEAIKNQNAASLQGVLELVPGTVLQPPGLDNVQQFGLRAVPIGPTVAQGSGSVMGPNAQLLASFGTQIVLDGVPASKNPVPPGARASARLSACAPPWRPGRCAG